MSEGNGQQESGNERLDRIERALELILNYRIEFREEHKLLLSAQVQMQGGLEDLRKTVGALAIKLDSSPPTSTPSPPTWNPCDRASTNA